MPLVKAPGENVIVFLSAPNVPVIGVSLRVAVISVSTMLTSSLAVSTMVVFTSTFSVGFGVVNKNVGAFVSAIVTLKVGAVVGAVYSLVLRDFIVAVTVASPAAVVEIVFVVALAISSFVDL